MPKRAINLVSGLVLFLLLLAIWQLFILALAIPPYMLPAPAAVLAAFFTRFQSLFHALAITSTAAVGGLTASTLFGIGVAILFAQSTWLRKMLFPYTILLQTVPIVAIAPLIIMWVGPGTLAVTVIAFIICVAPIIANTTQGLISVDRNLINLFSMHNASRSQVMTKLRFPHALPSLFVGIRISSGIAVIGAIVGELFAGSNQVGEGGLGYSINYANSQLQTDYLFALVLAATLLGFAFFSLASILEWIFIHHWHESVLPVEND